MALDAEPTLWTAAQIMFKHGTGTGVVTSNTTHRLLVAWIKSFITNRMSKLLMTFMTFGTKIHRVSPQHGRVVGPMNLMTVATIPGTGMVIKHTLAPLKLVGVT